MAANDTTPKPLHPHQLSPKEHSEVDLLDIRIRPAANGWMVKGMNGREWKVYTTWETLVGDLGRHFLSLRKATRLPGDPDPRPLKERAS